MGFAAARSKGSGNSEYNDLLACTELGNVYFRARIILEQVDGGESITNSDWGHFTNVKLSTENIQGLGNLGSRDIHLKNVNSNGTGSMFK